MPEQQGYNPEDPRVTKLVNDAIREMKPAEPAVIDMHTLDSQSAAYAEQVAAIEPLQGIRERWSDECHTILFNESAPENIPPFTLHPWHNHRAASKDSYSWHNAQDRIQKSVERSITEEELFYELHRYIIRSAVTLRHFVHVPEMKQFLAQWDAQRKAKLTLSEPRATKRFVALFDTLTNDAYEWMATYISVKDIEDTHSLLRPSEPPTDDSLLRPATGGGEGDESVLMRPSDDPSSSINESNESN